MTNLMLNTLQYLHFSHDVIKTIHHENWNYKLMRTEVKILFYQCIDIIYTIPFPDSKKNKFSLVINYHCWCTGGQLSSSLTLNSPTITDKSWRMENSHPFYFMLELCYYCLSIPFYFVLFVYVLLMNVF